MREASLSAAEPFARFPEDIVGNFLLAADLAPQLCPGCASYHLQYTMRRAVRHLAYGKGEHALDRQEIVALLARLLVARESNDRVPIEVTIAGSVDTGLLAMAAESAGSAGLVERVRFTVLDRCPTPLVLCAAFARRHGLTVAVQSADLLGRDRPGAADIVFLHGVFRFVSRELQVDLLNRLMGWLRPGGKLIFSMGLRATVETGGEAKFAAFNELFRREVQSGRLPFDRPVDAFLAGLAPESSRSGDLPTGEAVRSLFAAADVAVEHFAEIAGDPAERVGRTPRRVLAVLGRRT